LKGFRVQAFERGVLPPVRPTTNDERLDALRATRCASSNWLAQHRR
jgi:hypothetical protein